VVAARSPRSFRKLPPSAKSSVPRVRRTDDSRKSERLAPVVCCYPFTVTPLTPGTTTPNPEAQPAPSAPQQSEPHRAESGTGIFVTNEGHLITNAHVVKDCSEIRVGVSQGNFEVGSLVAKDPTNDLALLKVNAKPSKMGALRFGVRLGENVEAFGYPLSQVLATSGNFTTGNVTALAGIGDDSRFYQISAPVQPGNSGGPLLDESGNLVGIVTSKLNVWNEIKAQGDIPENVNFAIKASVAANFLQDNGIKFQIGEATSCKRIGEACGTLSAQSILINVGSACTSCFSRLAQRTLELRPAHSRRHQYVTCYSANSRRAIFALSS
jgi:serine protease Do